MQFLEGLAIPDKLLEAALTHSSYASEHFGSIDNERLEFIGDAVVGLAYSDYLYRTYPEKDEGELALARAGAVCEAALADRARALDLGTYLRLGRGEERSQGRDRDSLLADAFEALVGAIYLGCGWESARFFVISQLAGIVGSNVKDHKTRLQELLQASVGELPEYRVRNTSGPDHAKTFTVEVLSEGRVLGCGSGRSKKEAEQGAAEEALARLSCCRQSSTVGEGDAFQNK